MVLGRLCIDRGVNFVVWGGEGKAKVAWGQYACHISYFILLLTKF